MNHSENQGSILINIVYKKKRHSCKVMIEFPKKSLSQIKLQTLVNKP